MHPPPLNPRLHIPVILIPLPLSILFAKRNKHVVTHMKSDCAEQVNTGTDITDIHVHTYFNSPPALL